LIYSIGSQEQLSSRNNRWETIEELLLILRHNNDIRKILYSISTRQTENIKYFEYDNLTLLPSKQLNLKKLEISNII